MGPHGVPNLGIASFPIFERSVVDGFVWCEQATAADIAILVSQKLGITRLFMLDPIMGLNQPFCVGDCGARESTSRSPFDEASRRRSRKWESILRKRNCALLLRKKLPTRKLPTGYLALRQEAVERVTPSCSTMVLSGRCTTLHKPPLCDTVGFGSVSDPNRSAARSRLTAAARTAPRPPAALVRRRRRPGAARCGHPPPPPPPARPPSHRGAPRSRRA